MRIVTKEEEVVQPDVDIKQLLSFINPQELSKFISEYASTNPEFKAAFLKRFNSSRNRLRHQREKIIERKSKRFLIVSVTVKSLVIIIVIMITVVIGKLFSIEWMFF